MNPIRLILVHIDGSPASALRLSTARALAEQQGAEVQAFFAVTPMTALVTYDFPPGADFYALASQFNQERRVAARALFDAQVGSDSRVSWSETDGDPVQALTQAAWCADLLVLGQRDPNNMALVPAGFVESVIVDSGKPALVLPYITQAPAPCRVALVAWKNSRESARALAAAVPLLAKAQQVHVATWQENDDDDAAAAAATAGAPLAFLKRHGIPAQHHLQPRLDGRASRELGELLLSLANDLNADLLVMGCYGHTRASEWVLGGASRTLLQSMTVPVLMAH